MKTVRLGDQLEDQLDKIAQRTGRTVSEVVREAVRQHCERLDVDSLSDQLSDVVGAVSSGEGLSREGKSQNGQSRKTGCDFKSLMDQKHSNR